VVLGEAEVDAGGCPVARAAGSIQRAVTAFSRVKKSNPCTPYALASPNSDCFHPPNEWYATGTGIGTLMPIMPT
jgi:hypothetical protein